jgi:uncharacterized membrane protein YoaK (UPF0700 family)
VDTVSVICSEVATVYRVRQLFELQGSLASCTIRDSMFKHRIDESASTQTYLNWFLLSFLAGDINAGGFMATQRFVSHITGFATLSGVSAVSRDISDALIALVIPLFFLIGVIISGLIPDSKPTESAKSNKYSFVLLLVALLLALSGGGGMLGWFGDFGDPNRLTHDFFLLALLCGACGLLNGSITLSSGSTMRVTHLTGLVTDLGLGIAKFFTSKSAVESNERRKTWLRIGILISFLAGSFVGAYVYSTAHYAGFFFPMCLAFYLSFVVRREI